MSRNITECVDFSTGIDELLEDDDSVNVQEPEFHKDNESGQDNQKNKKTVKFEINSKTKTASTTSRDKDEQISPIVKKKEYHQDDSDEDNEDTFERTKCLKSNAKDVLKYRHLNNTSNSNTPTVWYLRLDRVHVYYILVFAILFIVLTLPSFVTFYKTFLPFCFNEIGPSYTTTGALIFGCVASLVHAILTLK